MKYDIELCMKVSEKQWIESLRNGTVCFNPIEVFIKKAEKMVTMSRGIGTKAFLLDYIRVIGGSVN